MDSNIFLSFWMFSYVFYNCTSITYNHLKFDSFYNELPESRSKTLHSCDRIQTRTVVTESPAHITGRWVSQSCEVRSGPEFILRDYNFFPNFTFNAYQYYYSDDACSNPEYVIIAKGMLKQWRSSWIVPGGTEVDYILNKVFIMPYTKKAAISLSNKINQTCPHLVRKPWQSYQQHELYNFVEMDEFDSHNDILIVLDMDCLDPLYFAMHEMQLMRLEHWKKRHPNGIDYKGTKHSELYLGGLHTSLIMRKYYRPTSYQSPLFRPWTFGCPVCAIVSRSHLTIPPRLVKNSYEDVILQGEWVSMRCETRPLGMFLTRRLSFINYNKTWHGFYHYYSDSKCELPTFTIFAQGSYILGNFSRYTPGAIDYDFKIKLASITPHDRGILKSLNDYNNKNCGKHKWELNTPQDVTGTYGCSPLGLRIPTTEYDIIKMDLDVLGNQLLYLGEMDTDNKPTMPTKRPTSYQIPLRQCDDQTVDISVNDVFPMFQARLGNDFNAGSSTYSNKRLLLASFVLIKLKFNFL